eukprot:1143601-Pelagomonas_calceolata.AAC.3
MGFCRAAAPVPCSCSATAAAPCCHNLLCAPCCRARPISSLHAPGVVGPVVLGLVVFARPRISAQEADLLAPLHRHRLGQPPKQGAIPKQAAHVPPNIPAPLSTPAPPAHTALPLPVLLCVLAAAEQEVLVLPC